MAAGSAEIMELESLEDLAALVALSHERRLRQAQLQSTENEILKLEQVN